MKYKLRVSVGVPADVVGEELHRIHDHYGAITPARVVNAARDPGAPLHPAFEWNDAVAGEKYRLHQARNIIRAVHVVDDSNQDRGSVFVRVKLVDRDTQDIVSEYRTVDVVVRDESLYETAIHELVGKLKQARAAVRSLELHAIHAAQGEKLTRVGQLVERAIGEFDDES